MIPRSRLSFCVLAIALGALTGCRDGDHAAPEPAAAAEHRAGGDGMTPGEMAAMDSMDMTPEEMARMPAPAVTGSGDLDIAPERLQAIGVRFEKAARRSLEREIRTVGRVAMDERRLARINVKIEGWIEQLHVNTTGEQVRRGEPLFALYSPDLVATQEEYLLALRGVQTLGSSEFTQVAEGSRSLLEAARRRLHLWDITDSQIRDLERTGTVARTLPIHAPIGGTVIEKMAVAGMRVMPGEDLFIIADLSHVWVLADIYEYELPLVHVGQEAEITPSYDPATPVRGRLAFIYPSLQSETRTARARFELDNPGGRLKPDMYVTVALDIPLGERLIVPKDAVLETGARRMIFVRRGEGRLAWREVKTGVRAGDQVEILEGLSAGEEVITSANFLIDSESQVKGAMAGMAGMDMGGGKPKDDMEDMPGMTEPVP